MWYGILGGFNEKFQPDWKYSIHQIGIFYKKVGVHETYWNNWNLLEQIDMRKLNLSASSPWFNISKFRPKDNTCDPCFEGNHFGPSETASTKNSPILIELLDKFKFTSINIPMISIQGLFFSKNAVICLLNLLSS